MRQSQVVHHKLRDQILEWHLLPGAILGEADLAQRLGVSRTPVREALRALEREGLVAITPQRGAVVTDISISSVSQLFQMRDALETYAARLAARQGELEVFEQLATELHQVHSRLEAIPVGAPIPDELHLAHRSVISRFDDAIRAATRNTYLQTALRDVYGHVARLRRLSQLNPARTRQASAEHIAICLAICARDESVAAQKTGEHLRNSLRNVLAALVQDVTALSAMSTELDLGDLVSEEGA
ncbi:GntR family transcriptional regulator [Jiangella asiatica]|uniref:GntR family transcriptional regulator n=1 Tax=Jiangella asiatica TaxID=2530372 RepID=UPI0013A5BE8F|nr:GntR family transcriptional regulator [Jiangella asiatica]